MTKIKTTKGKANRLDLTEEFAWGKLAGIAGEPNINRYDFFDDYVKHYAWCIGWQEGNREYREIMGENI